MRDEKLGERDHRRGPGPAQDPCFADTLVQTVGGHPRTTDRRESRTMTSAAPEAGQRRLRAGVIGLGWAGQQHVAAYAADPAVDLVALSAMEAHLLEQFGEEHDVPGRYQDWKQMVAEAELDVVSIATPTFLHEPMAIHALEAGLHVLTEKPMAQTGDAAARMVAAAQQAGRVLDVSFNHRQRGDVTALKDVVDSGVLGKLYYAKTGWIRRQGIPRARHLVHQGGELRRRREFNFLGMLRMVCFNYVRVLENWGNWGGLLQVVKTIILFVT